ncbi:GNAT family N-acetyltransferase [Candidatus Enterococcus clewellii]|uniref:N-acetyltransferase domain-containing protein n=1 Tax=Candidatus Enterococcus clewellii TaxID=1834193 RepID=A0A242KDP7_9ENTE|nr:GNAT family protein [Enterococcus sp. 9E7_DIV0242]OTP19293.1 hypothetical protein A5888_001108 [Enterococcus sp. 9E7_DIV0242]
MITTERTILRHFQRADLFPLHAYAKLVGIGESAGWRHHESLEETQQMLTNFLKNNQVYAIFSLREQEVIGHISVHNDSEAGRADTKELGFVLHPDHQNKGIMTEVIEAMLDHLFSNGIHFVYACCFQQNSASKRVIEKCGFLFEQEGEFFSESLNQRFDSYDYLFTKERWKQKVDAALKSKKMNSKINEIW